MFKLSHKQYIETTKMLLFSVQVFTQHGEMQTLNQSMWLPEAGLKSYRVPTGPPLILLQSFGSGILRTSSCSTVNLMAAGCAQYLAIPQMFKFRCLQQPHYSEAITTGCHSRWDLRGTPGAALAVSFDPMSGSMRSATEALSRRKEELLESVLPSAVCS